jgi:hypothetical protein
VHALPCCAWALNITLLLLCNVYNGFTYIPFASWAGAAGSRLRPVVCTMYSHACSGAAVDAIVNDGAYGAPSLISSNATNVTLADTIGRFSSTSHSFA